MCDTERGLCSELVACLAAEQIDAAHVALRVLADFHEGRGDGRGEVLSLLLSVGVRLHTVRLTEDSAWIEFLVDEVQATLGLRRLLALPQDRIAWCWAGLLRGPRQLEVRIALRGVLPERGSAIATSDQSWPGDPQPPNGIEVRGRMVGIDYGGGSIVPIEYDVGGDTTGYRRLPTLPPGTPIGRDEPHVVGPPRPIGWPEHGPWALWGGT